MSSSVSAGYVPQLPCGYQVNRGYFEIGMQFFLAGTRNNVFKVCIGGITAQLGMLLV